MTPRAAPPATPTLRVPIGVRWVPALLAAIGSMLAPFAVSLALAPRPPTLAWFVAPVVLGALLPMPVTILALAKAARGEVVVADGALRWAVDGRSGRIDLGAPFTAEAWVDAAPDADVARVVLQLAQGEEALAVAYTIAAEHAPSLSRRTGGGPAHLVVSWRARRDWEAVWAAVRSAPGRRDDEPAAALAGARSRAGAAEGAG